MADSPAPPIGIALALAAPTQKHCSFKLPVIGPCRSTPIASVRIKFAMFGLAANNGGEVPTEEGTLVNLCGLHLEAAQLLHRGWIEHKQNQPRKRVKK